ncbi:integrase [Clostridiales Family XIII bacterium PM5-7]
MAIKRNKGEGSIRKLQDGKYQVRLQYQNTYGELQDIKRKASSKTEAEKLLASLKKGKERERNLKSGNMSNYSIERYVKDFYLPWKEENLKPQAYRRIESTMETHIIPMYGSKIISQLTAEDINRNLQYAYEQGKSHSTIKKIFDGYKNLFKFATRIRRDIEIYEDPTIGASMIPERSFQKKEVKWFEPDDIKRFAEEASRRNAAGELIHKYGEVFLFLMTTGLREGEVCALKKSDVNLKEKMLTVDKGINTIVSKMPDGTNKYTIEVTTPKTRNSIRVVPLMEESEKYAKSIMKDFPDSDLFIHTKDGNIVRPDTLYKQFNKILDSAGLDKRGMHTLRHTYVTALFENGVEINTIAAIIGDTEETVKKTYLHLSKATKIKAITGINIVNH